MDEPRIISSTLIVRHAVSLVNLLSIPKFSNYRNSPCYFLTIWYNRLGKQNMRQLTEDRSSASLHR